VTFFDALWGASESIRTIDPQEKHDQETLTYIQNAIRYAQCIYVLGFGFDQRNCQRIGLEVNNLQPGSDIPPKTILFTNYNDSNRVNKAASKAFVGDANLFLRDNAVNAFANAGNYYEKSIRDCYGALALDFDDMEENG
jgi:hypothetical protein